MPWEVFSGKGRPVQGRTPTIAVQAQGRIALNQAAYDELGCPSHVELLYDPDTGRIGMRSVAAETPHAYKVTQPDEGGRWVVVALAFSRHYGIKGSRKHVFAAHMEDGVLAAAMGTAGPLPPTSNAHEEEEEE